MAKATSKVRNVTKAAKKAGRAHMTFDAHVKATVEACGQYLSSNVTMQHGMALWQSARMSVKAEVMQAAKDIAPGRDWDRYKKQVRVGMVRERMCPNTEKAGRVLLDIMASVGLTGRGVNGKRKNKSGQPPKTDVGENTVSTPTDGALRLTVINWCAAAMKEFATDTDVLERVGELRKLIDSANKVSRKAAKKIIH